MILRKVEVKIYYGAADTVECLATAHVDDLVHCVNQQDDKITLIKDHLLAVHSYC